MNRIAHRALQGLMWFVSLSHLAMGLSLLGPRSVLEQVASLYGATVSWSPQFEYILRPIGAFMIGLGIAGCAAALDPRRYRVVVVGFIVVLGLRVVQRIMYAGTIESAFGIASTRNVLNASLFGVLALLLLALLVMSARAGAGSSARTASSTV